MERRIKLVYKANSPVGIIELAILTLLENGISKIFSRNKESTIMSVLYIFSQERIADALANLCNNEIISINYKDKMISYTPIFSKLLSLSNGFYLGERLKKEDLNFITEGSQKAEMLREKEPFINFFPILSKIDFKVV